ncbi:hypothetical protein P9160_14185 [Bacillus halotolerans]|uniref:PepSY domain-containing protein n=1 Tax=Bacillus halotolerans TaxID=260554 RepID=UPI001C0EAB2D|nr:hypothetical protein [Bacillus halotolerans]MBU5247097.1 hypothetical protein [Bacillus halotolerans]MCY8471564.1 hypothetical protein [Bacillus halotolerans]MEC1601046.1 hypothetical protein [Bacillus halotolerans]MEC3758513.1 hypothetical protein [Bacillus halotolerans]
MIRRKYQGTVQSAQMKKVDGVYVYVIKVLGEDGKLHTFNVQSSMKVMKHQVQKPSQKQKHIALRSQIQRYREIFYVVERKRKYLQLTSPYTLFHV